MPTKIDWADETINPLGWGCYGPGGTAEKANICSYCYAARFARRKNRDCPDCQAFRPHWHPEQLKRIWRWKKSRRIFVQSMGDLFGDWVPKEHIYAVLSQAWRYEQHKFFFLTKNPKRLIEFSFPENAWAGVSVTNQVDADERIPFLVATPAAHRFVSFEPLLGPVDTRHLLNPGCYSGIDWVIIGAQTGPGAIPPAVEWVGDLTRQCLRAPIPIFHKDSLAMLPWLPPAFAFIRGTPTEFRYSSLWRRDMP